MKLKIVYIICAYLIFCAVLASCGANDEDTGITTVETAEQQEETIMAEEEQPPLPDFPHEAHTFNGKIFNILVEEEPMNFLKITDFEMEEEPSDVLNTAIFRRNRIVEEMLDIKITSVNTTDVRGIITRAVRAGIDDYDAVALRLWHAAPVAMAGEAVNLNDLQYLSLDMSWWDQNIIRDMSVDNQSYLIAGDIFTKHYDAIAMIFFNKRLLADYALESPYALVENNQWTLDKFGELTKNITRDLDGDGAITHSDMFGFSTQADFLASIINGSGAKFVEKDNDDIPYFTGASEKISDIINKVFNFYISDTFCVHRDALAHNVPFDRMHQFMVFPESRSLFLWGLPRFLDLELRNMEDDFGMLPIPKYDSGQDRYYATANTWHSYAWLIPQSAGNPDTTAYIMDAMAYHGRIHILPAYYDVTLTRKHTRDEESGEMLDIIFNSAVYDIGVVYNLGSYIGNLESMIQRNVNNMASEHERVAARIETDLNRLIEQFTNR